MAKIIMRKISIVKLTVIRTQLMLNHLYYAIPKVSFGDKAIIFGCFGYLISSFDLIPDFISVIGYLDDAAVLGWAAYRFGARVDDGLRKSKKKSKRNFWPNRRTN